MHKELNRRAFLLGAEAIVVAAFLNRAYAGVLPVDVAATRTIGMASAARTSAIQAS